MSIFDSLIDAGKDFFNVVVDVVTFPFETVADGFNFLYDKIGDGIEFVFDAVNLEIIGDIANWFFDRSGEKIESIINHEVEYIKQLPSTVERTINDVFNERVWNNFGRWIGGNVINAAELLDYPNTAEFYSEIIKFNTRGLNDDEIKLAKSIGSPRLVIVNE